MVPFKIQAILAMAAAGSILCPISSIAEAVQAEQSRPAQVTSAVNRPASEISPPPVLSNAAKRSFKQARPHLVLALSGGACKAAAEIGVLRSFDNNHIAIDGIIGTSMGATIGALYCAGMSPDDIEQMFLDGSLRKAMLKGAVINILASPLAPVIHLFTGKPFAGLMAGKGYQRILAKKLPASFEQLKIPFAAVVTNLTDGQTITMAKGNLPKAVFASGCVPIFYRPILIDGKLYADGGLKANLPANIAEAMGADIVVAVLVDTAIKPVSNKTFKSKWALEKRVVDVMLASTDKSLTKSSDILIYPDVDFVPPLTKDPAILKRAIAVGEKAADSVVPKIEAGLVVVAENSKQVNTKSAEDLVPVNR